MKVKFLKQHNDYQKGDVVELHDDMANYLLGVKAAEKYVKEEKKAYKTKEDK